MRALDMHSQLHAISQQNVCSVMGIWRHTILQKKKKKQQQRIESAYTYTHMYIYIYINQIFRCKSCQYCNSLVVAVFFCYIIFPSLALLFFLSSSMYPSIRESINQSMLHAHSFLFHFVEMKLFKRSTLIHSFTIYQYILVVQNIRSRFHLH